MRHNQVQSLKLLRLMVYEKKKMHYLIGVKVTGNVAQYPLHNVTYPGSKFEVVTSNG